MRQIISQLLPMFISEYERDKNGGEKGIPVFLHFLFLLCLPFLLRE
jgi:hypothetical protein